MVHGERADIPPQQQVRGSLQLPGYEQERKERERVSRQTCPPPPPPRAGAHGSKLGWKMVVESRSTRECSIPGGSSGSKRRARWWYSRQSAASAAPDTCTWGHMTSGDSKIVVM